MRAFMSSIDREVIRGSTLLMLHSGPFVTEWNVTAVPVDRIFTDVVDAPKVEPLGNAHVIGKELRFCMEVPAECVPWCSANMDLTYGGIKDCGFARRTFPWGAKGGHWPCVIGWTPFTGIGSDGTVTQRMILDEAERVIRAIPEEFWNGDTSWYLHRTVDEVLRALRDDRVDLDAVGGLLCRSKNALADVIYDALCEERTADLEDMSRALGAESRRAGLILEAKAEEIMAARMAAIGRKEDEES